MLAHQNNRIKLMREILPLFGDTCVLKGGTALMFFYNLDRYSEDLDFDAKTNNMNFINKLKYHKDFKNWKISIKKDTNTVFRAMIDYGDTSNFGAYPLKIEISNRNKEQLQNKYLTYKTIDKINVYNIDELINMKYIALNNRDKSRDFYDIWFLLKNYPDKFDKDKLFGIREKIFYFGQDEINILLNEEMQKYNLTNKTNYESFSSDILKKIDEIEKNNKEYFTTKKR